jgi:predicted small integral membrane protein
LCFNAMCWRYMCACFRLYDGRCWSLLLLAFFAFRALAPFAVKRVGLIAFVSSRGVCLLAFVSSLGLGCVSSLLAFCGCHFSSCPSCVMRVGAGVRAALSRRG